eukprot:s2253_g5.t1
MELAIRCRSQVATWMGGLPARWRPCAFEALRPRPLLPKSELVQEKRKGLISTGGQHGTTCNHPVLWQLQLAVRPWNTSSDVQVITCLIWFIWCYMDTGLPVSGRTY